MKKPINYLNDAASNLSPEDLINPDIAFFAKVNHKHAEGHGLLTFVPVTVANMWVMIRRYGRSLVRHSKGKEASETKIQEQPLRKGLGELYV